ncbi:hypothetical protein C1O63_0422 [Dehalococcoides mccartyi]|nr:hypothetical protein C1O63_0422 [Dehalococcoides mccartyi]
MPKGYQFGSIFTSGNICGVVYGGKRFLQALFRLKPRILRGDLGTVYLSA